jgi:hypothetical protein
MEVEAKAKVKFMGEIVTPPHSCSTWNEKRGYLTVSLFQAYPFPPVPSHQELYCTLYI